MTEHFEQNISLKSLYKIMTEYASFYPSTHKWEDTIAYMLNDPIQKIIVEDLMNELKNSPTTTFREPILIERNEDFEERLAEAADPDILDIDETHPQKFIYDGTHRVVASYLYGAENILAADYGSINYEESPVMQTTIITGPKNLFSLDDEVVEQITDRISSFPLDEKTWARSEILSFGENSINVHWNNESYDEELLNNRIKEELHKLFPQHSFIVKTVYEDNTDENDEEINVFDEEEW